MVRSGKAVMVGHGLAGCGRVWLGVVRQLRQGWVWFGKVRRCKAVLAGPGWARQGRAWYGKAVMAS